MERHFWVYIVTDKPYGTLYVGITNDIARRMFEHKQGTHDGFTKRYGLYRLVYCEEYPTALDAITQEKRIKKWNREWKINNLIHKQNRQWRDLAKDFNK